MNTQSVVIAGTAPTFAAPSLSDTAEVGAVLIVKNGSASPVTVTLITNGTLATGDAYPDKTYSIAAGAEGWLPVLHEYQGTTNARFAAVTFSAVTSVTAAVVHLS
jgi:hypothetical protein